MRQENKSNKLHFQKLLEENKIELLQRLDYSLSKQKMSEKEILFVAQEYIKRRFFHEVCIFLRKALKEFPKNISIAKEFIFVLNKLNYFDEALEVINSLLLFEQNKEILIILGNTFEKKKEYKNALKAYEQAKKLDKTDVNIYISISRVLLKLNRLDFALAILKEGLIINDKNEELLLFYANQLFQLGYLNQSQIFYQKILSLNENSISALINLGVVKKELKEFDTSLKLYQKALLLSPKNAGIFNNLGVLYKAKGEFFSAYKATKKALILNKKSADTYANMGAILKEANKPTWAIPYLQKALKLNPLHVNANLDYAITLMLFQDYKRGFLHYEFRKRLKEFLPKLVGLNTSKAYKKNQDIKNKKILILCEQGFGDALQFARYISVLKSKGAYVILRTRKELKRLFEMSKIADEVILEEEKVVYDYHFPLLSIAYLFDIDVLNFKNQFPYLLVPKEVKNKRDKSKKIAFAFGGSNTHKGHKFRYIDPNNFAFLTKLEDVEVYSFQMGEDKQRLIETSFYDLVIDKTDEIEDFYDSACLLVDMDLLITSDTSIAHLAGALGVETWLCLPINPDWRWGRVSEDTFWYPNMKLFRQSSKAKWSDVFSKIENLLKTSI